MFEARGSGEGNQLALIRRVLKQYYSVSSGLSRLLSNVSEYRYTSLAFRPLDNRSSGSFLCRASRVELTRVGNGARGGLEFSIREPELSLMF